jgi:spore germination cell wall hydrolase CwlJ-like protein
VKKIGCVAALFLCLVGTAIADSGVNKRHLDCLAHVIYGEARGEIAKGQYDVGWSVRYRAATNSKEFGGPDICKVAHKRMGKYYAYDGVKTVVDKRSHAWERSMAVARLVLMGYGEPAAPVMYFCSVVEDACDGHDKSYVFSHVSGRHRFYTDPRPKYAQIRVEIKIASRR